MQSIGVLAFLMLSVVTRGDKIWLGSTPHTLSTIHTSSMLINNKPLLKSLEAPNILHSSFSLCSHLNGLTKAHKCFKMRWFSKTNTDIKFSF